MNRDEEYSPSNVVPARFLSVALLVLGACSGPRESASETPHWGYEGETGPARWASLDPAFTPCASGERQSPIDIRAASDVALSPLTFSYATGGHEVLNNGHTVQVQFKPGNRLSVGSQGYELKQFHFHAPSENHVEGKSFPLEAHFVHADSSGSLAVVGVMFEEGQHNTELEALASQLPKAAGAAQPLTPPASPEGLLPFNRDYYHFAGSLTTPPCSEGVKWIVLKGPVNAAPEQMKRLAESMGHANNRPVQPLNGRVVEH